MNKISTAILSVASVLSMTSFASAADMAVKAPPPPVATCIWCGFYIGGSVGYGWGTTDIVGSNFYTGNLGGTTAGVIHAYGLSNHMEGAVAGGQIGYNTQISPNLVVGVEADIQWADLKSSGNAFVPLTPVGLLGLNPNSLTIATSQRLDWFGTVRGRLGFTPVGSPNLLLYGTGGVAFGHAKVAVAYADFFPNVPATISGVGAFDDTRVGWTAGAGFEWALPTAPAWSFKAEYLYTDLGSVSGKTQINTGNPGIPVPFPLYVGSQSDLNRFHTVRVGVNYHFGGPLVAKY